MRKMIADDCTANIGKTICLPYCTTLCVGDAVSLTADFALALDERAS